MEEAQMIGDRIEVNMAGGLDIALPRMVHVRQKFQTKKLDSVTRTVVEQFKRPEVRAKVKPGMTIAVGCGSRGINNIGECAKAVVAEMLLDAIDRRVAFNATEATPEEFHNARIKIHCGERFPIVVTPSTSGRCGRWPVSRVIAA